MRDQFYKMRNAQHEQGLRDMISWLNNISPTKEMRMVEIGSYVGESTLIFAENFKHVISVDPYIDNYDMNDDACYYAPFYEVYKEFLKNTVAQDNIKSLKLDSATALPILSNYKFDFVYIDGIHTIEGVHHDIVNYMPLIKPGGFLSGHDYGWGNIRHVLNLVFNDKVDAVFNDGSWVVRL